MVNAIDNRFDQANFNVCAKMESLLVKVIPQSCIAHPYCARFLRH